MRPAPDYQEAPATKHQQHEGDDVYQVHVVVEGSAAAEATEDVYQVHGVVEGAAAA